MGLQVKDHEIRMTMCPFMERRAGNHNIFDQAVGRLRTSPFGRALSRQCEEDEHCGRADCVENEGRFHSAPVPQRHSIRDLVGTESRKNCLVVSKGAVMRDLSTGYAATPRKLVSLAQGQTCARTPWPALGL